MAFKGPPAKAIAHTVGVICYAGNEIRGVGDAISMAAVGESSVCRLVYVSTVPRPRTNERFDVSGIENDPQVHFLQTGPTCSTATCD